MTNVGQKKKKKKKKKQKTEKLGGLKIKGPGKGPFLKMLPQLPFAFRNFILSVSFDFN